MDWDTHGCTRNGITSRVGHTRNDLQCLAFLRPRLGLHHERPAPSRVLLPKPDHGLPPRPGTPEYGSSLDAGLWKVRRSRNVSFVAGQSNGWLARFIGGSQSRSFAIGLGLPIAKFRDGGPVPAWRLPVRSRPPLLGFSNASLRIWGPFVADWDGRCGGVQREPTSSCVSLTSS